MNRRINPNRRNTNNNRPVNTQALRQVMAFLRTNTKCVSGPADPPHVVQDVVVTKITESTFVVAGSSEPVPFLISNIATTIPGGAASFPYFRIQKVSIWGSNNNPAGAAEDAQVIVTFPKNATFDNNDGAQFSDYGTVGQKRPQLHISPSHGTRIEWHTTSDTSTNPFMIFENPTAGAVNFIVHLTLELRSASDLA
jgi:hypothetical protein